PPACPAGGVVGRVGEQCPGVEVNCYQYDQEKVGEAADGVKGEKSVKVYGNDLSAISQAAEQIKAALAEVKGITDLAIFTSLGQPTVRITVDREKAARYGLAPGDVNTTVQAAVGGQTAGELKEYGSSSEERRVGEG
ncbi:efflux RND transporter permease subunit, partial [Methylobacterium radiotolerans]|uniref:efflux RND transporter permease subunit n=1 Tax=Methylobacterium radiotolerans TaxID=31998 RepID=UPI000B91E5CA